MPTSNPGSIKKDSGHGTGNPLLRMKQSMNKISPSRAQLDAQAAALSHQLHLQSISTLTQLLSAPNLDQELINRTNKALISLLEPFTPSAIIQ